jgi:chitinase
MLFSFFLLVAPFVLLSTASTLPKSVRLGPGEDGQVQCEGATVTETVWLPEPTQMAASKGEGGTTAAATTNSPPAPSSTMPLFVSPENATVASGNATARVVTYRNALYFTNWFVPRLKVAQN